ncbi:peritrophin-1-like [Uranotaenia lowii]|uniref:peritrophin-1-like n=1 Tax=Uranotaenia lowii TaxID=190385 RepID=UPI0024785F39|nr:peritrophin-1-like [Uranotaenia lowii]
MELKYLSSLLLVAVLIQFASGIDPRCPAQDNPPFHMEHPTDCTKFLKCHAGEPVVLDCPSGLHWNNDRQYCDWPELAGCSSANDPIVDPTTTDAITVEPETETVTTSTTTTPKPTTTTSTTTTRRTTTTTRRPAQCCYTHWYNSWLCWFVGKNC